MKILIAALALAGSVAVPAYARDGVAAVPATENDVERLVGLLVPDDAISRLAGRALDAGMDKKLADDAALKAVYDKNPGLRDSVSARLHDEFGKILLAELPSLRREIAGILSQDLTPAEIGDTLTFFSSPTGQKLRAEVYATMGENPSGSPQEMQQNAMAAVMAKMTPEDYPALMAFGSSSAAQKMGQVNPKIAAASEAWATRLVTTNRARIEAMAAAAVQDYLKSRR